ncbi:MAG: HEAT repeat domain-containing protein [bacterium]|nr:HEAT repeat domain-containing protein [bacterium]
MNRRSIVLTCMVVATALVAGADTVHFKDGSKLNGTVSRPNPNCVMLEVNGGRMVFPVSQVASVEENDAEGTYSLNEIRARKHNDIMRDRTGLTREQRDQVRSIVAQLNKDDPMVVKEARDQLLALGRELPVHKYLGACLPYMRGPRVPEMMQLMVEMDPEGSERMLLIRSQDLTPTNRAKALELIGTTMKEKGVERLAQGMIDQDREIQVTAAHALGEVGDKRASLALLEGVDSNSDRVFNASRNALAKLWSTDSTKVNFETADEWHQFIQAKAPKIADVVDPSALTPLVVPDPEEGLREYVDE